MRRDFNEYLRMFCVLGALLIIVLVMLSALVAGCKPRQDITERLIGTNSNMLSE